MASSAIVAGCWIDRSPLAPTDGGRDTGAEHDLDAWREPGDEDVGARDAFGADDAASEPDVRDEPRDAFAVPDAFVPGDAPMDCAEEACNRRDDDCDGLVDEAGCATSGGVSCTAQTVGSAVYLVCPQALPWPECRDVCETLGYALARVDSAEENAAVQSWIEENSWIGLNDREDEGRFRWTDGSEPTFTGWAWREPNDLWNEDCVVIRTDGEWNDADCEDDSRAFVCEATVEPR